MWGEGVGKRLGLRDWKDLGIGIGNGEEGERLRFRVEVLCDVVVKMGGWYR